MQKMRIIREKSLRNLPKSESNKKNKNDLFNHTINSILLATSTFGLYKFFSNNKVKIEDTSIHELKEKKDTFEKITVINDKTVIIKKKMKEEYYKVNIPSIDYFEKKIETDIPIVFETSVNWTTFLGPIFSLGILGSMLYMMNRNGGGLKQILDMNKTNDIIKNVETKFKDVVGQRNAKRSVMEFVDILKNKDKYKKIGVKVPKGALLSGPPGTGKTLLAKAIAGEANLPFVNMTGSDFNAMFVGVGSTKIKNLYKTAKKCADENGGCIVFIDEIDAIGQKRNSANMIGGNSERENTLNQLLTEMDGFTENKNVMTFAATNRPELLDPALLRSGRFDRKIVVDLPTKQDREDLFSFYLNKLNIDKDIVPNISKISSTLTSGLSGADISNIVNEAGIISVRNNKKEIEEEDIKSAIDYVLLGDEKDKILLDNEKTIVSYHESGHAYFSYILPLVENPVKVSIIPREKGMLGFSQSEVSDENLISKKKIEQYIMVLMAGRACEEIFCEDVTNGAFNDIEKATNLAKQYIKTFGFNKSNKFLNTTDNLNQFSSEISNYLKDTMDKELLDFLNFKYSETCLLVDKNKENIESIKDILLERENIYLSDIKNVIDTNKIFLNPIKSF
tara:strand:+ start:5414 stop:7276 length:1863 start_codon:yes stop_codon:yes gene_type:complete